MPSLKLPFEPICSNNCHYGKCDEFSDAKTFQPAEFHQWVSAHATR